MWSSYNPKDRQVFQLNASQAEELNKETSRSNIWSQRFTNRFLYLPSLPVNKIILEDATTTLNSFPGFNEIQSAIHIQGRQKTFLCYLLTRHYGYGIRSMSGRYASYWNAFLFWKWNTKDILWTWYLLCSRSFNFILFDHMIDLKKWK